MITLYNRNISTQELIDIIEPSFSAVKEGQRRKRQIPHRVKFNGKYIVTKSKKTIWSNIGAAKLAVLHHMVSSREIYEWLRKLEHKANMTTPTYYGYNEIPSQIIKYLESQNIIEYVPQSEEM